MGSGVALVTGAAGFIGQHLCGQLSVRGWSVRGIDDERSGDWSVVDPSVEHTKASLESLSDSELRELLTGVNVLFHLAAEKYNSPRATAESILAVNVKATHRLFDAAGRAGARKVVFASSVYAYGNLGPEPMHECDVPRPSTLYGVSKVAGEHLLRVAERDHGLPWTVARLFFVYGPRQYASGGYKSVIISNFERLRAGERPLVNGDGKQALDYVYVDDCVEALLSMVAGEHARQTYNVSSGRAITINELTRVMLDIAGSELEPLHCDPDWTRDTIRVGASDLAARELKWLASSPINLGVAQVWEWMNPSA